MNARSGDLQVQVANLNTTVTGVVLNLGAPSSKRYRSSYNTCALLLLLQVYGYRYRYTMWCATHPTVGGQPPPHEWSKTNTTAD
jgi:hypothetical protein